VIWHVRPEVIKTHGLFPVDFNLAPYLIQAGSLVQVVPVCTCRTLWKLRVNHRTSMLNGGSLCYVYGVP
jgi:hypothetical protein